MAAHDRARTAIVGPTVEEALEGSAVTVASNREPYSQEYERGATADATEWIERVFEPLATELRADSPVPKGVHDRGD